MEQVQQLDRGVRWRELSVVLTHDEGIATVHEQYLGKPGPTDVISFNYDPMPNDKGERSGELVVNVQRAVEEGPLHHGISFELAFYLAHGCHHLTGATDTTLEQRNAMHDVEKKWIQQAASMKLLDNLFEEIH